MAISLSVGNLNTLPVAGGAASDVPSLASPAKIESLDLKTQFATIRAEVMEAVTRAMESQQFILGDEVRRFEEETAAMLGARFAVACASGSDALLLAMMALGIGPGDEVITTPFTFFATAGSIARLGAKPVFVDIEAETYNIDPAKIEAAITPRTRAILPVHLFGLPAALDEILNVAHSNGLHVIEDAAQAIGALYRDRHVGTYGAFGCFSFFPSKNLGGAGDGGMLTTEDAGLADRLRLLRVHGSKKKYFHELVGMNSRLDALQAAILRVKLAHLASWTAARQARADRYRVLFDELGLTGSVVPPAMAPSQLTHVYNQFVIRSRQRDALREFLRERGISSEVYYPQPLHLQPAFASLGHGRGSFPVAESASGEVLALPIYPELTESQQIQVAGTIAEFYAAKN
jgi:dTDP-4-amino-4,6-dideoxygalactose transaminase